MKSSWTRRHFVGAAARVPVAAAIAGALWSCSDDAPTTIVQAALSPHDAETLQRVAYLLFPYPDIGPAPYEAVARSISDAVAAQPETGMLIRRGVRALDQVADRPWLDLDEDDQLGALASMQSGPFFQFMLNTTKSRLFNDTSVWAHIGYDPNYPLNDIDWLDDE